MTTDQNGQQYTYDTWNRMMVAKNSSGSTINQYAYDGQNRQILNSSVYRYFSIMSQNLQSGTTAENLNQYQYQYQYQYQEVYNPFFVDGVMEVDTATATPGTYNQRVYGQWNANWDMTSITDTTGTAVERYEIDPYGKVIVLTGSWGSRSGSSYGWTYFHQGMRLDTATGLYQGRARDYSPSLDRWMQEDPIWYKGGMNLYEFERDNPLIRLDPSGKISYTCTCTCTAEGLFDLTPITSSTSATAQNVCRCPYYFKTCCKTQCDAACRGIGGTIGGVWQIGFWMAFEACMNGGPPPTIPGFSTPCCCEALLN
jgi:RHS repeat-associated protein